MLYPFQQKGASFLQTGKRLYLADEMGLGKTVQALSSLLPGQNCLVICPAAVRGNWEREAGIWAPESEVLTVSYASLHHFESTVWDLVILDEAHYAKSHKAKRTTRALKLAAAADRAILLSGTPMPNHPGELWAPIKHLWPELLPKGTQTYWGWLHHFCVLRETKWGMKVVAAKNQKELKEILQRFMLRRRLRDVALDLPPLRVTMDILPCTAESFLAMLEQEDLDLMEQVLAEETKGDEASLSRLRRLVGEYKAPWIAERLAAELDDGMYEKVVVMYYHTSVGDILADKLRSFGLARLDGRTRDRQSVVNLFTEHPDVRVFLGQQKAAGEGLNLQAANEIVLCEPDWTPDGNRQAIKRIHRIGQDAPCRARVFAVAKTLDEGILDTLIRKTNMQREVGL